MSEYFSPNTVSGDVDVWNVILFVFLVSVAAGLVSMVIVFLAEKFLYCGRREFPSPGRAIRLGFAVTAILGVVLMLHVFHFLNIFAALIVCTLVIVGIMFLR